MEDLNLDSVGRLLNCCSRIQKVSNVLCDLCSQSHDLFAVRLLFVFIWQKYEKDKWTMLAAQSPRRPNRNQLAIFTWQLLLLSAAAAAFIRHLAACNFSGKLLKRP